jgi:hypothetical protein
MEPVLLLITEDITLESDFKRLNEMENYKMKMLASISHEVTISINKIYNTII